MVFNSFIMKPTSHTILALLSILASAPVFAETIPVNPGETLEYKVSADTTLTSAITGDETTTLYLHNANAEDAVTFTVDNANMGEFLGTVHVGDSAGAGRTAVVTQNISQPYLLDAQGDLVLTGSGTGEYEFLGGTVRSVGATNNTQSKDFGGTVTIAEGAKFRLDNGSARMALPAYTYLNVDGEAMFGSEEKPYADYMPRTINLTGQMTVYYDMKTARSIYASATLPRVQRMTVSDTADLHFHYAAAADSTKSCNLYISQLTVDGEARFHTYSDTASTASRDDMAWDEIEITYLQGEGDFTVDYHATNRLQKILIRNLGAQTDEVYENYHKGDISLTTYAPEAATLDEGTGVYYDMGSYITLQKGQVLDGVLRLNSQGLVQDGVVYGLAGIILGEKAKNKTPSTFTVHGIDDTGSTGKTFLSANGYDLAFAMVDPADPDSLEKHFFTTTHHTLELTGSGNYTFSGTVYKNIGITMNGTGSQTFSGDTSRVDQDITVNSGSLLFQDALGTAAETPLNVALNAGTLKLSGANIGTLTGAATEHGATLKLGTGSHSEVNTIDVAHYTGHFDVQLEDGHVALTGSEGEFSFGDSFSSTGSSGIEVAEGMTLVLHEPINVNGGDLSMKGSFNVSEFELLTDQSTHVDTQGTAGRNGFVVTHVTIANVAENARTIDKGATLIHTGLAEGVHIYLSTDGRGVADDGDINFTDYVMVDDFTSANVSDIKSQAVQNLQSITMHDGTLTVDADTDKLTATGGTIKITNNAVLQDACTVEDVHIRVEEGATGTIAGKITGASDVAVEGKLNIADELDLTGGETQRVQIAVRSGQTATLAGTVSVNAEGITGQEGDKNTVENASILTHSDFVIRDVSLEGTAVDLAEGTTGFLYNVEIQADSRITDDAATLSVQGTTAFLNESNTIVSGTSLLPENVMLYRSGDTAAWAEAKAGLSLVDLDSELISKVMLTGSDLLLNLVGLGDNIGGADLVSVAFAEGAVFNVDGLRVYATLDGTRRLEGFVKAQSGTVDRVYFFTGQIPEPTTGTLGLLALAALAARRRRK